MVFSFRGCLSSIVRQAMLAVPKRKTDVLNPSEVSFSVIPFVVKALSLVSQLVWSTYFDILIALRFLGLSVFPDSEYLLIMKVLTLLLN